MNKEEIKDAFKEYLRDLIGTDKGVFIGVNRVVDFFDTLPERPKLKPKAIVIRPAVNLQKELMGVSAEVKDAVMLLLKDGWSLKAPDSEIEFDQRAVCAGFSSTPPKFKLEVKPEQPAEGLDLEIGRYWNRATGFQPSFVVLELTKDDLAKVARHFAEWGMSHSFTHHEPDESLKQAVLHQMEDDGDVDDFVRRGLDEIVLKYAQLGAEWQKAKMMEEAVGGRYMKADGKVYVESWLLDIDPDSVKAGDAVRIILIPEDE